MQCWFCFEIKEQTDHPVCGLIIRNYVGWINFAPRLSRHINYGQVRKTQETKLKKKIVKRKKLYINAKTWLCCWKPNRNRISAKKPCLCIPHNLNQQHWTSECLLQVPGSFYLLKYTSRELLSMRQAPYLPAERLSNRGRRRSAKRISILV